MADNAAPLPAIGAQSDAGARRFVIWLLLAALLPIPVFALLSGPLAAVPSAQATYHTLFLVSIAHGGLSGLFWLDRRYRGHMATQPRRYYLDPAILAALSITCAILLGGVFTGFFVIAYIIWTICHFARQNWGVLCLAALGTGSPRPSGLENTACYVACLGGVIGVLPDIEIEQIFGSSFTFADLRHGGFLLILLGLGLTGVVIFRQIMARAPALRIGISLAIGIFFLPVYAFGRDVGFVAIGSVHGAQYAVIMLVLAADSQQGSRLLRASFMLACAAIYLGLFLLLTNAAIWGAWLPPAQVLLDSVVIWHFMIDAGLWRLRQPFQRAAVRQSFPFLFAAKPVQE